MAKRVEKRVESIDAHTGTIIASHPLHVGEVIEDRVARTHGAVGQWRRRPVADRAAVLVQLAAALREERDGLADLLTAEMGKRAAEA